MKNTLMKAALFVFIFMGALCSMTSCQHKAPAPTESASSTSHAAAIKTEVVLAHEAKLTLTLNGQVFPVESGRIDITAPINGVILTRLVKVGDQVVHDQPIAIINSVYGQTDLQILQRLEQDKATLSQAEDNANQAQAELTNATLDFHRKKILFEGGVMAKSDMNDSEERLNKAKSVARNTKTLVQLARVSLERDQAIYSQSHLSGSRVSQNLTPVEITPNKTYNAQLATRAISFYIRTPIAGTVTNISMAANQSVSPGSVLATVINLREIYIDANAHESDLPFLRVGSEVSVSIPAYQKETFSGRVSYVGRQIDPSTRTILVRTLLHNPNEILKQGMFVSVLLSSNEKTISLTVPDSAVLLLNDKHYVYIEKNPGKYEKREVVIGSHVQGKTEILSGISPGAHVVTEGNLLLEGAENSD